MASDVYVCRLKVFDACWQAMERCFAEDVFLPQLLDKLWRLCLQLVSRLLVWLDTMLAEGLAVETLPPQPASSQQQQVKSAPRYIALTKMLNHLTQQVALKAKK